MHGIQCPDLSQPTLSHHLRALISVRPIKAPGCSANCHQMSMLRRPPTLHRCVKFPDEGCGAFWCPHCTNADPTRLSFPADSLWCFGLGPLCLPSNSTLFLSWRPLSPKNPPAGRLWRSEDLWAFANLSLHHLGRSIPHQISLFVTSRAIALSNNTVHCCWLAPPSALSCPS